MCNKEQGYYQSEMTTPTREQVVQLRELFEKWFLENSQNHHAVPSGDDLLYQSSDGNYLLSSTAKLFKCFVFARADLETTIAEKDAEISHLRMALADTEALEIGTGEKVISQQAHIEVLSEALEEIANWLVCAPIASAIDMAQSFPHMYSVAEKSLAIQSSTDALREHDAKLVEDIADRNLTAGTRIFLAEIAEKIRKGEF